MRLDQTLVAIACLVFFQVATTAHAQLGDGGLVAWWTFETGEGEVARDRTDNNNNASLENGTTWAAGAGFGTALKLDGNDDFLDCGDNEILDIGEKISLSAWIHPVDVPAGETWIVGKTHDSYALAYNRDSTVWFYVSGGENNPRAPVPVGAWSHVVGTYNGKKMKVYVNGELEEIYSLTKPIASSGDSVWIGRTRDAYFNGMIDDVRIYRRPLSTREIREHYAAGKARLPQPAPVDPAKLQGLTRRVYDAGEAPTTIDIATKETVEADLTVPPNVRLRFEMGGRIQVAESATLTITGPLQAPLSHLFEGPGRVEFDSRFVKEVYPQWWGARADRKTDDTAAIQAAIDSYTRGGRVFFINGTYGVNRTIVIRGGTRLIGDGAVLRGVVDTMLRGADISVRSSGWRLRGIALDGLDRGSSGVGIDYTKHSNSLVEDVQIRGFDVGILLDGGDEASMYNTFRKIKFGACNTAVSVNNSTIAIGFYDCIIGNVGTGFLINTTNQFVVSNTTIEGFETGIDMRRGDTMHADFVYFAGGKVGIRIAEGVSECTLVNPRFSQVTTPIDDQGSGTHLID